MGSGGHGWAGISTRGEKEQRPGKGLCSSRDLADGLRLQSGGPSRLRVNKPPHSILAEQIFGGGADDSGGALVCRAVAIAANYHGGHSVRPCPSQAGGGGPIAV